MTKQEFENMACATVTAEEYKIIEKVYTWHPAIRILSRNGFLEDSPHIVQIRTSRHTPTSRTKTVRSTHSVGPENTRDTVSQEICH